MSGTELASRWQPVTQAERYETLDVLRGVSLFGVLLVNLLTVFRVSLFEHMLTFHTHPGLANRLVDVVVAAAVEFKAFALFSLMFGAGVAIQAERAAERGAAISPFLVRRFMVLLALGLCHMLLIWNGDILALFAVCGLLIVAALRLSVMALALLGLAAVVFPFVFPPGITWPGEEVIRAHAARATFVYANGGFLDILAFRWRETWQFMAPLLLASLPKTAGLMLWGVAAWRAGVVREPQRNRPLLQTVAIGAGLIGGTTVTLQALSRSTGLSAWLPAVVLDLGSQVVLPLAYAAGILLWLSHPHATSLTSLLAAAGQMALTNYLVQSVVLGVIFYGYGFGMFGRLGPATGALIGLGLYTAQLIVSRMWLRRYRFGPAEWLWRSATYGTRQPMLRAG